LIVDQENSNNDPLVWTGSHNWSNNANNKNDENTVIIHDQNVANQFYQEFYARFIENGGSIITGTKEQTGLSGLIYPNPNNTDQLNLTLANENANDKHTGISIYNSIGQLKFEQTIDTQKGINSINIDISALASGIYYITIKNNNNQITKKLIRN
jgi:phosphatidylserine/phosphatidylglycerophosphate/cardiolipin synthase-like enzyme